jgi:hypothetical protein
MDIFWNGSAVIGLGFLCYALILVVNPGACEILASILLSRAAAHRASRKAYERAYERSRGQSILMIGGTIHQDAVLASLCNPELAEARVDVDQVTHTRAALRAGER